jgi:hypothetical protein
MGVRAVFSLREAPVFRMLALAMLPLLTTIPAHAKCPPGKITCAEWCANHPEKTTCMSGQPYGNNRSCDAKPQGAATCVRR